MKHYTFVDYATQAYLVLVGMLVMGAHQKAPAYWPQLLAAHAAAILVIHVLVQLAATGEGGSLIRWLRYFYPVLLYTGFYREAGALNQCYVQGCLDPGFIRFEQVLFGCQPSLRFMEAFPYPAISEVFYAAYFSYYIMITGIGVALFCKGRAQFLHYISVVTFVFYACYLIYIFVPVIGPRIFFRDLGGFHLAGELVGGVAPFPVAVQEGFFCRVMALIYQHFEAPGAAFPSSHVAIALTTLYFSWRYLPRLRWVHALAVTLLCGATVYCRYHYVVDVLAGFAAAGVLVTLGNYCYERFEIRTREARALLGSPANAVKP